jgi:hypothetical protein
MNKMIRLTQFTLVGDSFSTRGVFDAEVVMIFSFSKCDPNSNAMRSSLKY